MFKSKVGSFSGPIDAKLDHLWYFIRSASRCTIDKSCPMVHDELRFDVSSIPAILLIILQHVRGTKFCNHSEEGRNFDSHFHPRAALTIVSNKSRCVRIYSLGADVGTRS